MSAIIVRIVEAARRHAAIVVVLLLGLSVAAGIYAVTHISLDTDLDKLISQDEPWRKLDAEMDKAFPQNADLLVIVIDGVTTGQTEDAAIALTQKLRAESGLFRNVRMPDINDFFRRDGLLLLPKDAVQSFGDQMIQAQPFLGTVAA
ncbi:MAG TPA: hopanoid biosynthesis-associated RND transporter HpnN, partial [Stellaceae bacterium]|nr:hopanoid biosynthesis-associated RND transporter HpnN [Stellaceae bacterium]